MPTPGRSTVAPAGGTPLTGPTGTVQFYADAAYIASAEVIDGVATLVYGGLAIGAYEITAVYSGDGAFSSSTSAAISQAVIANQTAVNLVSSLSTAAVNQLVTFTATVTPAGGTPFTGPTGVVHFYIDGFYYDSVAIIDGEASLGLDTLAVGEYAITARYDGDDVFAGSVSDPLTQTIV